MPAKLARYREAVVSHIMVDGADEALDFYAKAFGAEELFRTSWPNGKVSHAEITIQDSVIMVGDAKMGFAAPEVDRPGGSGVLLHVWVDDVDAFYTRAVEAGAESLQSPIDLFHGDREVILKDPFGHIWIVLQQIEEVSIEETVERANELLAAGVDT